MRGCLFTLLLGVVVVALIVVVGLPAATAAVLTAGLNAAGLQAADTAVTVSSDPPTDLLGLHADHVRVHATKATLRGMRIGTLDLDLSDVQLLTRRAAAVDGRLADVTVAGPGGQQVHLDTITIGGGGDAITATTTIPNAEAEALIADAFEAQTGTRPTSVTLTAPDRVAVKAGVTLAGTFDVNGGGDLIVRGEGVAAGTEIVLLHGGQDVPIDVTSVRVTPTGGLRLGGDLAIGILG